ncbi:MAG: hypothetical protein J6S54_04265 [Lentisphaeria bacterium]|nr:hypothetical protein [Lentisphaeria bacterium]
MKAINIILSILIFLLSAVAATFSYFLFEKRSQFVTGWGKMAAGIENTARALDKDSGTKVASQLTRSALAHENYANLSSLLPKLSAQAESVIVERNYLADALLRINGIVGNTNRSLNEAALRSIDTYNKNTVTVVSGVRTVIANRNKSYAALVTLARRDFGVNIDRNKLINGDNDAFKPMETKLRAMQTRMRAYDSFIARMGSGFGVKVDAAQPEANIKSLDAAVNAYRKRFQDKDRECRMLTNTKRRLEGDIKRLNGTIASQKNMISDRNKQITSFQRAFGLSDSRSGATPWLAGSAEARAALVSKVVSVNSKFGYIAIDAGKYSVVQQQIGNRALEVNPNIEPGLAMLVTRRNGAQDEFVARVQVSQVGEVSSIANIPPDSKPIQVGDIVTIVVEKPAAAAPAKKSSGR